MPEHEQEQSSQPLCHCETADRAGKAHAAHHAGSDRDAAALWPSVPKIVETRYLGSAYSLIFWSQNIGLCLCPMLFGVALKYFNAGRTEGMPYDYTRPMLIFVACGVLAMLLGLWLKAEDRKKKYGLELPNIKK